MKTPQFPIQMTRIIMLFCLVTLSVSAGTVNRKADFEAATAAETENNFHGGLGAPKEKRWSYFLLNKWDESYNPKTRGYDWGKALNSDRMKPFKQSAPFLFEARLMGPVEEGGENYFERYRYTLQADYLSLCYNRNDLNPAPELTRTAIVMKYAPVVAGNYSLLGELKWASVRREDIKDAWYVIGKMTKDKKFTELYRHEFIAKERFEKERVFVDLEKEKSLQGIELSEGDELVVIIAGSRLNYAGLEIHDGDLKISSDVIETVSTKDLPLQRALSLLDLENRGLSEVKSLYEKGDLVGAFEEYKQILIKRVAGLKPVDNYRYWLYHRADADDLLKGILTTQQYGRKVFTTTTIGLPGNVQWYQVPEDGYTTLLRDINTMHWVTKLAEKYAQTGDVTYLNAWQGYWSDFADNWPSEYRKARANPEVMALVDRNSIAWSDIALYIGWRIEAFSQGFNAIAHEAAKKGHADFINNTDLAKLLVHLVTFEASKGSNWIERNVGVPNQRVHCATSMFELGVYLNDFKAAPEWRKLAIMEVQRSGFLADGTDMEQSLGYNAGLPKIIRQFLKLAEELPESEKGPWLERLKHMYQYRYYYLHAIAKPDGSQPIVDKNNTWRHYTKETKAMPGLSFAGSFYEKDAKPKGMIQDFSLLPLSKRIQNYVYGKDYSEAPAFDSIYFPYGGYVVQRDGWQPESLYAFMKTSRPGSGHKNEEGNGLQISAFGQDLLVSSGGEAYDPDQPLKTFWRSTASNNSIIVDGYSQNLRYKAEVPVTYKEPIKARYLTGNDFDFAEGMFTGAYSGLNIYKHGKNTAKPDLVNHDVIISDVTHKRELIFLRKLKIWIITDMITSEKPHEFTQTWLLAPEYKPEMVEFKDNQITTKRDGAVNFAMYQFGQKLNYSKPYGVFEEDSIIGFVGMESQTHPSKFTPAVNVLAKWKGEGKQVLISAFVPFKTDNPVKAFKSLDAGFEMTLNDGQEISYRYLGGEIEAELKTTDASLVLTANGGYEQNKNGQRTEVIIPKTFIWEQTANGEVPQYK